MVSWVAAPRALTETRTAAFSASLLTLGPLALMLYAPALPLLESALGITKFQSQLTVVSYFIGFVFVQLFWGPFSDAFGRRLACLVASAIFCLATIGCIFSQNFEMLILFRVLQGVGTSVGSAMSRAIVRDTHSGAAADRILNLMALMLGIGPALLPFIGGYIAEYVGWREVFVAMLVYGVIIFATVYFWLPETNQHRSPARAKPGKVISQYVEILTDRRFLLPTTVAALIISNFYAISNVLPYSLIVEGGLTASEFGTALLIQPVFFTAGSLSARWLLRRMRAYKILPFAMSVIALSAVSMMVLVWLMGPTVVSIIIPLSLGGFATAYVMPVFYSTPLLHFGHAAGAASAMFAFIQYGCGLIGSIIATFIPTATLAVATIAPGMLLIGCVLYIILWKTEEDE